MRGRVFISEIWWYFAWSYYSAERVKTGYAELVRKTGYAEPVRKRRDVPSQ